MKVNVINPAVRGINQQRWQIFTILALMYILVYFYRVSLAVVAGDVSQELSLSPEQLGAVAGALFYAYAITQIPLGPLVDRFGGRLVITLCGILTFVGGVVFAQAQTITALMLGRVLLGIGTGGVLMSAFVIFSKWYSKQEFGKATGMMVAVGNIGNIAGTAPLALLVGLSGWRGAFLAIAIVQLIVTLLVFLKVRNEPEGGIVVHRATEPMSEHPGMLKAWKIIIQDRSFWLLAALSFCWFGNFMAVQGIWGGPYLMEVMNLSREMAGRLLMWVSIGFMVGSAMMDGIARRVFKSYKWTLIVGQCGLLLLMTGFLGWLEILPSVFWEFYFLAMGLTVSSGVMMYPIVRGAFPVAIVGTALTLLNFFVLLGAAVAQHSMGFVVEWRGGYSPQALHAAFFFPLVCLLVTVLLYLFAKNQRTEG
ncbi:MAG: MFS transporter [Deltaproteobacteria bacterium]|nr:MFS transporter [Deltaproteobacteria bacterium]